VIKKEKESFAQIKRCTAKSISLKNMDNNKLDLSIVLKKLIDPKNNSSNNLAYSKL